ncbi:LacI family DNA-binding transcriptional regulator [Caproiciproducens sp. MSJ-32]|uniref:LacI family DNA-binding transcriptional regulator n=1 Tax=Caproiciproducens sp. MSJ-32 TaxID=2841527 RepID=UPI001C109BD2|nr:LacI family DNA-binding transcriptional regulator [Caproiciproducens sp. MSJ-32]MBU5456029.1 LacI family transcriptional regulator [Caproiciproducens sp. MSJ-32]
MAVTIDDIAKRVGVSPTTVSRVINNSSYVKTETREKVLEVIKEMNYVPSAIARNLSKRENNTIGIIVPDITNSYFGEVIKGISKIASEKDLNIILFNTNNDVNSELKALREIKKHRLKGVIMTPSYSNNKLEKDFIETIESLDMPIVLVSADLNYIKLNGVFVDDFKGGYDAASLLIKEGHRKIGIIKGITESSTSENRLKGYKKALLENNIEICEDYIKNGEFSLEKAYEITMNFLDMENPPTALIVCSNKMTLGVIKGLFERNKGIPKDISLIAFNKIDLIDIVGIKLTYIEDSPIELGKEAIKLLIEKFETKEDKIKRISIPPKLVLNGSEKKY